MSNAIPVIKFCFRSEWKSLAQALEMSQAYESEEFASPQELLSYVSAQPAALVICSLANKEDLVQIATLLKLAKKMRECILRVVVVNVSKNKQYELAINKLGVQDILEITVPAKSLRFKIDLWMKALRTMAKPVDNPMAVKSSEALKKAESENKLDDKVPTFLPAMTTPDDIWLQPKDFECKKVLGRWLMRLMGPGPYVAQWVEVTGKKNVWRFEFSQNNKALFIKGAGEWYYRGEHKPEFNWKENLWYMTGDSADLFYYDTEVRTRLQLKDKLLSVAGNSTFAKAKEKAILETFDKDLVFKNGAPAEGEADSIDNKADELNSFMKGIEGESQKGADLQGKGKTDHLEQKDLSGKAKNSESNTDPLSGKSKTDHMLQSDLKGKGHAAVNRGGSSLEMKLDGEDSATGPYQGKTATSKLGSKGAQGPAGGQLTEADLLDLENKNQQHETKYKGHFEPEQFEASEKEKKEREAQAGKSSGPLAGKGSTSQLDHSGLKGPAAGGISHGAQLEQENKNHQHETKYKGHFEPETFEASEKERKEREKTAASAAGPMSGKSSTSHLDQKGHKGPGAGGLKEGALLDLENKNHTHETKYKGHHEAEKFEAKEARKNQYHEDDLGGEYGGKSDTDRLKKHYGNRNPLDYSGSDDSDEANEQHAAAKLNRKGQSAGSDKSAEANVLDFSPAASKKISKPTQQISAESLGMAEALNTPDPEMEEASQSGKVLAFMVFNNKRIACELDDFFDDQAIFRLAACELKDQDQVDLDLSFDYLKKLTQIKVTGIVTSHDVSEDTSYVSVTLDNKRVQEFDSFMKIYQKRQQNVEFFMKKVKGL